MAVKTGKRDTQTRLQQGDWKGVVKPWVCQFFRLLSDRHAMSRTDSRTSPAVRTARII